MGQVRVQRLCHLYDSMLLNDQVVPTTYDQGVTNEPISKINTNNLALPISYCMGTKISVPGINGEIASEVENCIRAFSEQKECEIIELNVQIDHVHLLVMVPPKISISDYVGMIKGRTAIRVFNRFKKLKSKPYWGNSFWSRGYCVDTVGLDSDMIRKYVKYQERK